MLEHITAHFPKLHISTFQITSVPDQVYNCIAWAMGVTNAWWWPLEDPAAAFWPESVPRVRTLDAFRAAFATLGYFVCADEAVELGFEKVALFVDALGLPTHAARQLANGRWTSKLGKGEDIEHELHDLEGEIYGMVVLLMKRQLSPDGLGQPWVFSSLSLHTE